MVWFWGVNFLLLSASNVWNIKIYNVETIFFFLTSYHSQQTEIKNLGRIFAIVSYNFIKPGVTAWCSFSQIVLHVKCEDGCLLPRLICLEIQFITVHLLNWHTLCQHDLQLTYFSLRPCRYVTNLSTDNCLLQILVSPNSCPDLRPSWRRILLEGCQNAGIFTEAPCTNCSRFSKDM